MIVNPRLIMTASAVTLGIAGLVCIFLPAEIQQAVGTRETPVFSIVIQLLGATYFAFALLNWTAKGNLIGGIYSRPVAFGNFAHFLMSSLTLVKFLISHNDRTILLVPIIICVVFALAFWKVITTSPV